MLNIKRILASVMAIAIIATTNNIAFGKTDAMTPESAALRLKGVGILKGDKNGNLNLKEAVTRAEAAMIMTRILGQEKAAEASMGVSSFSDMQGHWATGAVEVARVNGLIKGYPDGTFKPEEKVTYAQMTTMMVRALGAGQVVEKRGTWPMNIMNFASSNKLTDDVVASLNQPMLRGQVAILADNVIDAPLWEVTGYSTNGVEIGENEDGDTLLTERLDLKSYKMYTVTAKLNSKSSVTGKKYDVNEFEAISGSDVKKFEFVKNRAIPVMPGMEVDILVNDDDDVVSIKSAEKSNQTILSVVDVVNISRDEIEVLLPNGDKEEYDYNSSTTSGTVFSLNGHAVGRGTTNSLIDEDDSTPGIIILNDDNDAAYVHLTRMEEVMVVDDVDFDEDDNEITIKADKDYKYTESSIKIDFDEEAISTYNAYSKLTSIMTLKQGDMLLFSSNKEYLQIIPVIKISGSVDGKSKDTIEVDGKELSFNPNFENNDKAVENIDVDDEVDVYLDVFKKIIMMEKTSGSSKSSGDYAVITEFYVYKDQEEGENVAKIRLFDLESGKMLDKMVFDAEETDEEADKNNNSTIDNDEKILGVDRFYDTTEECSLDDKDKDKTDADEMNVSYQSLVGRVVEYDIKSEEVVIYKVDNDEIAEDIDATSDDIKIDVSKGKFTFTNVDENFYVDEDDVKVYQATELDDNDLKIASIEYSTLKDKNDIKKAVLVSFDNDKEIADYVYIPMLNDSTKVSLNKSNSDYIGVVTNIREKSNEDVQVTVMTNDGEVEFRVEEDEAKQIKVKPIGVSSGSGIKLNGEDAFDGKLEGVLVSFSMDDEGYVTEENAEWSNDVKVGKFYEISSKNEVELRDLDIDNEVEFDAYTNMTVVDSDITRQFTTILDDKLVIKSRNKSWLSRDINIKVEVPTEDDSDLEVDINSGKDVISISLAKESGSIVSTIEQVAKAMQNNDNIDDIVSVNYNDSDKSDVFNSSVSGNHKLTDVSVVFEDIEKSDESDIDSADEGDDFEEAEKDEANTIYYYLVEIDDDEELVDINVKTIDEDNSKAVAIIIFDEDEF